MKYEAAYLRISQDQTGMAAGVQRQEEDLKEWCASRGDTVLQWYVDNDVSATTGKRRPAFEQLLADLRPGSRVVVWHMDRLVRTTRDLLRVIETGCTVHALHSGHIDLSNPTGIAVAKTITAWAEYEGQQKSLRQKSSHRARAASGGKWWKNRPFGYNMDGTEHPTEGPAVRRLYANLLAGVTLTGLAADLNGQGITTSRGNPWRPTAVRRLLMAHRNAGIITYNDVEVGKGQFAALVSEDVLHAAQSLLSDPARRTGGPRTDREGRTNLLVGIATCAVCEGPVRLTQHTSSKGNYRSYACRAGHCSARQDWADARAEEIVLDQLTGRTISPEASVDTLAVHAELQRLRERGDSFVTMLSDDQMSAKQFSKLNKANRERISDLQRVLALAGPDGDLHKFTTAEEMGAHWRETMTVNQRHAVVRHIFSRIAIHPRGRGADGTMSRGDVEFYLQGSSTPIT